MDFWDLTKLLARRWQVALPMLVLSTALTVLVVGQVKPDYIATAYIQLVAPVPQATKPDQPSQPQRNPWLSQGLEVLGNAAIVTVRDQSVVDELKASGFSDAYTIDMKTSAPLITIEVTGSTERQARDTAEQLADRLTQSSNSLQSAYGVPSVDMITARRLDNGTNVKISTGKVKRALVAVAAAGLLLTIAVTVGVDAWLRRRARRRREAAEAALGAAPAALPSMPMAGKTWDPALERTRMRTSPAANGSDLVKPAPDTTQVIATSAEPAKDGNTGKDGVRGPLTVEYQSASHPQRGTDTKDRDHGPELEQDLSADATVVLPLSALPAKPRRIERNTDKRRRP